MILEIFFGHYFLKIVIFKKSQDLFGLNQSSFFSEWKYQFCLNEFIFFNSILLSRLLQKEDLDLVLTFKNVQMLQDQFLDTRKFNRMSLNTVPVHTVFV